MASKESILTTLKLKMNVGFESCIQSCNLILPEPDPARGSNQVNSNYFGLCFEPSCSHLLTYFSKKKTSTLYKKKPCIFCYKLVYIFIIIFILEIQLQSKCTSFHYSIKIWITFILFWKWFRIEVQLFRFPYRMSNFLFVCRIGILIDFNQNLRVRVMC